MANPRSFSGATSPTASSPRTSRIGDRSLATIGVSSAIAFEQDAPKTFPSRGNHEHVSCSQEIGHVGACPEEGDDLGQAQLADERSQPTGFVALASRDENTNVASLCVQHRETPEKYVQAFLVLLASCGQNERLHVVDPE